MLLKDLTLLEKLSLVTAAVTELSRPFHEKPYFEMTEEDIRDARSKANRLLDLIEEFGFDGKKLQ